MKLTKQDLEDLIGDGDKTVSANDITRFFNRKNAPVLDAMAQELIALMHKYGVYFNPAAGLYDIENLPTGMELGVSADRVHFDTLGELTRDDGKEGFGIFPLNPPNAHQKMAQTALRRRLMAEAEAEAKDRPEGGAE